MVPRRERETIYLETKKNQTKLYIATEASVGWNAC